jgi:hypothetical protein
MAKESFDPSWLDLAPDKLSGGDTLQKPKRSEPPPAQPAPAIDNKALRLIVEACEESAAWSRRIFWLLFILGVVFPLACGFLLAIRPS